MVADIASSFGSVRVNSTCRSHSRNARVGGARRSHHLTGDAVDFRVSGNVRGALAYLRSHGSIGGVKHYGGGLIHADTGPRRRW
ncbi:MAG: D-Ala-D-Ala carboxypeptidase family metallohydrolase [Hyphomicrobium aestuarii]|nr:D-Ala-D-Ala carboxypeptidase family metallohydrolase [Hyphomicrobium aestuarii]